MKKIWPTSDFWGKMPFLIEEPPASEAVQVGNLLFICGQVGVGAGGEVVAKDDFVAQARQALENLKKVLAAAGATLSNVVKVTWYLTDIESYPKLNPVRREYFTDKENWPVSTVVVVKSLAVKDWLLEVDTIAVVE